MTAFVVGLRCGVAAGLVLFTLYGYRWPVAVWMAIDFVAWELLAVVLQKNRRGNEKHLDLTMNLVKFTTGIDPDTLDEKEGT